MWELSFISEQDFKEHVKQTIKQYGDKLVPFDLQKFNKNIIDPVKLIFDKTVYRYDWETIVKNEIFRQRDKSNNNDIGYFHQRVFQYISNCTVPSSGWDVIYTDSNGILLPDEKGIFSDTGDKVERVYVEMKNKHNTMNSASGGKTYIKMQGQLLKDDNCACFLVEAIAKKSQNVTWKVTVDKSLQKHRRIRRVSIDEFYKLVTGQPDAFYQMCLVLPRVIEEVVSNECASAVPHDTVMAELNSIAEATKSNSFSLALYMLGFSSYLGFNENKL